MRTIIATVSAGALLLAGVGAATAAPAAGTGTGATATGSVFVTNPVQSLADETLTDQKDADGAVPAAAYHDVTLTNLDGSGYLTVTTRPSSARRASRRTRPRGRSATPARRTSSSR